MPKVSIVVPTYNVEKYLKECMESIINQTLQDIEIICVDDGSTDSSGKILDEYAAKDSRIKVIHKQNEGYGKAMNVGFDNATSEYIGIVEPDDYIALDMYETLYNLAKEKDLDLIKADFHRFVGDGDKRTFHYEKLTKKEEYYNKVIDLKTGFEPFGFAMNTWAGIYKRAFIEKNHIRHNETPGASYQDNGFWFQTFTLAEKVYFYNKPFYKLRRDNPNSSINNKEKVYCVKEEYNFIEKFLEEKGLKKDYEIPFYMSKLGAYRFTVNRIASQYKKIWLKEMVEDFREVYNSGILAETFFSKYAHAEIKKIVKNYHKYYRKTKKNKSLWEKEQELCKKRFFREITSRPDSRIVFWGASMFLKEFLEEYTIDSKNILGIIDKNPDRKGGYFGGYEIFMPEAINDLNPNIILISVINLNKDGVEEVKKYIHQNYKKKVKIITIKN